MYMAGAAVGRNESKDESKEDRWATGMTGGK